jgi:hypothetical protein
LKRCHNTPRRKFCGIRLGKYDGFRKNELTATPSASVTAARYAPGMRRAGKPTMTASMAPATPAAARQRKKSTLYLAIRSPATTPPTPAKANWPRLTLPDQPVSTTSDRAMIP